MRDQQVGDRLRVGVGRAARRRDDRDVFQPGELAEGERVCAYLTDCLWLDIGRPDDYARAQQLVEATQRCEYAAADSPQ